MQFIIFIVFFFSFGSILSAYESIEKGIFDRPEPKSTDYVYNPHVSQELWEELLPYFLPIDHPIKVKLDRIFQKKRVTLSEETFEKAGFKITRKNRPLNAVVSGHKDLQGYLVKVYLDSQHDINEWRMWLKRIKGVEVIRRCLQKHGFTQFDLPRKWIYPLPAEPSPPLSEKYHRKNFILVVEDMHILDYKANEQAYKKRITKSLLKALYTVLEECELTDCVYIGNMPFTESGKIAFIDTELYFNGHLRYNRLKKYLSVPMQNYLDTLISEDRK